MKIFRLMSCVKCGKDLSGPKCTSCGYEILKIQDNIYSLIDDNNNKLQDLSVIENRVKNVQKNKFSYVLSDIICREFRNEQGFFLDIGCGTGFNSDSISRCLNKKVSFVGIDLGNPFDFRKASDDFAFIRTDIFKHPFKSSSFDGIMSLDVIEHIQDDWKFLEIVIDLLKKNGKFVIGTPNKNRIPSLVSAMFNGKKQFPYNYGHDDILGDIIHVREYGLKEITYLFDKYSDKITYYIKPTLLGAMIAKSAPGIINHGNFFKGYTYYWLVFGQKK